MTQEWIEWLEISQPDSTRKLSDKESSDVSSKRCPRCGWLDHISVSECFRCGYNYLSGDLHSDYISHQQIGIPGPTIQTIPFEDWKLKPPPALTLAKSIQPPHEDGLTEFFLRLQAEHLRLIRGF